MKSGVVLMRNVKKKWKSEKLRQKVNENNQHFIKPPRAPRSTKKISEQ